jgi:hypothetical protein
MNYLLYVEGLEFQKWQLGETEKAARTALWESLTDMQQNAVIQIECIDIDELCVHTN